MKDGYYLSTYLDINELGHLLDLPGRHDQNISLWEKTGDQITLVHYWELERRTGIKMHRKYFYDNEHAVMVINYLLGEYNLSLNDMCEVWGTPRIDRFHATYHSVGDYRDLAYHSIAHLFSSLMMDTNIFYNETILSLAVDGSPDIVVDGDCIRKSFYAGGISRKGQVDLTPVSSPGILWSYASDCFKLREGTLMALASACSCAFEEYEPITIDMRNADAFQRARIFMDQLYKDADKVRKDNWVNAKSYDDRFTEDENLISMAMKVIQTLSLKMMDDNIDQIVERYGINTRDSYLAISGGYGLNCPTNSHLMNKYGFKGLLAPPCASDSGISLGIALYSFYKQMDKFVFHLRHASYGDRYQNLNEAIKEGSFDLYIKDIGDFDLNQAVSDMQEAPIVWFYGAAEIGPRALGNRSIIADPRREESRDRLNEIKHRQWWRPVAPIILEHEMSEWFVEEGSSPFMLQTFSIREDKQNRIPAVAHLDGSSRVQTINRQCDQSGLYDVISAFQKKTGVPIICNTSLNDIGEPIINRIEEALNFALRKNIRVVYINKKRVELHNHNAYRLKIPMKRPLEWTLFNPEEKEALLNELNPHKVNKNHINILLNSNIDDGYIDLKNSDSLRKLRVLTKISEKMYAGFIDIL